MASRRFLVNRICGLSTEAAGPPAVAIEPIAPEAAALNDSGIDNSVPSCRVGSVELRGTVTALHEPDELDDVDVRATAAAAAPVPMAIP